MPEDKKQDNVVIPKEEYEKLRTDIELLKSSTSRYKLEEEMAKQEAGKEKPPRGHMKRLKGKLVIGWMGINEPDSKAEFKMLYQGTTPVGEILKGHYKTLDDKDIVCESIKFTRSNDLEYFTKIGHEGDEWVVKFDNPELPQKYNIPIPFLNP